MGYAIYMIFVGLLGASGFILAKRPDAQSLFAKVAPFQGFIGIGAIITAVLWLLSFIGNIGAIMKAAPVRGVIWLAAIVVLFGTGFLLGFGLIAAQLGKNPAAKEKAEQLRDKLIKFQIPMGFACIIIGVLSIVF